MKLLYGGKIACNVTAIGAIVRLGLYTDPRISTALNFELGRLVLLVNAANCIANVCWISCRLIFLA